MVNSCHVLMCIADGASDNFIRRTHTCACLQFLLRCEPGGENAFCSFILTMKPGLCIWPNSMSMHAGAICSICAFLGKNVCLIFEIIFYIICQWFHYRETVVICYAFITSMTISLCNYSTDRFNIGTAHRVTQPITPITSDVHWLFWYSVGYHMS